MLALINDTGMLVVIIALVLLFGASQIPKLARNLGEAGKEFRKAHAEAEADPALTAAPHDPAQLPNPSGPVQENITLTPAQLDTLLAAHETRARAAATTRPASNGTVRPASGELGDGPNVGGQTMDSVHPVDP